MKLGRELAAFLQAVRRMPPPARAPSFEGRMRCVCGATKDMRDLETIDTGVVQAINNVCRGCKEGVRLDRQTARIVCCGCHTVVARMAPHRDRLGFEFRPNVSYHVENCGGCVPGLESSDIIEKLLYDRTMGNGPLRAK